MSFGWCTIESDPSIIHSLLGLFRCRNLSASEVYSLDEESMKAALIDSPGVDTRGLLFLFKYDASSAPSSAPSTTTTTPAPTPITPPPPGVFFASQTIQNACCTQALLHILFNLPESSETFTPSPSSKEGK